MTGRVLVLGGSGMLGHKLFDYLLRSGWDARCTLRGKLDGGPLANVALLRDERVLENVDAMSFERVAEVLRAFEPTFTINCIGIVKQRPEANDPIPSITVNSLLPHRVAELVREWEGRLVHVSTDCVFDGKRGEYQETDPSDALDLYGRTKFLGEVHAPNALTLRTSMIGRELVGHRSLLDWFLQRRGERVNGFTRHVFTGLTTNHLAVLIERLMLDHAALSGLYHVSAPRITKHDLLCSIRDAYDLDIEIVPDDSTACDRSLRDEKFRTATGIPKPTWPELIDELARDPTPYGQWCPDVQLL